MTSDKRLFLSYSHTDRDFAERLARDLVAAGQEVWYDKWDIQPGDSIVSKIFEEGLAGAAAFAIVLSKESVRSNWVRDELNLATVRRIEDLTRVIPILKEDVELPTALRTLRWIDMRSDFPGGVRAIVNALAGLSDRPQLGDTPAHLRSIAEPVVGLSRIASTVGQHLLRATDIDAPFLRAMRNTELLDSLQFTPAEINDAVDELESQGLAETHKELGTHPFDFTSVEATYLLYHAFGDAVSYSARDDVKTVLGAIAALESADGPALQKQTGLSAGRLNRAVDYVKDHGLADILLAIGTAPYSFMLARGTRATRQASLAT